MQMALVKVCWVILLRNSQSEWESKPRQVTFAPRSSECGAGARGVASGRKSPLGWLGGGGGRLVMLGAGSWMWG